MTPATELRVLRAARELIATEDRWCNTSLARDEKGRRVNFLGPTAHSFSFAAAIGRMSRAEFGDAYRDVHFAILKRIERKTKMKDLLFWERFRTTTHERVLRVLGAVEADLEREVEGV